MPEVSLRGARPEDLPAILELTCQVYGEQARERMNAMLHHDSSYRPEQSRVAEVDGAIVSHVRVADRPIRYGGAVLRMGGVGAVATLPAYRGQGLASALLEDAIGAMRSAGYHLSMLFTGIPPFYARLGWAPFSEYAFRLPLSRVRRTPAPGGYRIRRFDPVRDLTAVERVYDDDNHNRTGSHLRPHQHWLDGHSRVLGIEPALVAERGGGVVAYASFRTAGPAVRLYEACCLVDAAEAFRPLARAIVDEALAAGATEIEGQLPRSHDLLAALQELTEIPIEGRLLRHMMLQVIDLRGLFQAALPTLTQRLHRSGSVADRRSLGFRVAGEYARLSVERDAVNVDAEPTDHVLDLQTDLFFRLFLGELSFALLEEELVVHGIVLSDQERTLLTALFPAQDPVYWRPDHF